MQIYIITCRLNRQLHVALKINSYTFLDQTLVNSFIPMIQWMCTFEMCTYVVQLPLTRLLCDRYYKNDKHWILVIDTVAFIFLHEINCAPKPKHYLLQWYVYCFRVVTLTNLKNTLYLPMMWPVLVRPRLLHLLFPVVLYVEIQVMTHIYIVEIKRELLAINILSLN